MRIKRATGSSREFGRWYVFHGDYGQPLARWLKSLLHRKVWVLYFEPRDHEADERMMGIYSSERKALRAERRMPDPEGGSYYIDGVEVNS